MNAACPALKRKEAQATKALPVWASPAASPLNVHVDAEEKSKADVDPQFLPFILRWFVSLTGALSSDVFLACTITLTQAHKMDEIVDLSGSFMATLDEKYSFVSPSNSVKMIRCDVSEVIPADINLNLNVNRRETLIKPQQSDPSLVSCFSSVVEGWI